MASNRIPPLREFYKRLLRLYPRQFRERFTESMEQTFADLLNERPEMSTTAAVGFTSRMTAETVGGICKEHAYLIAQGDYMKHYRSTIIGAAVVSSLIVLPLIIMEQVNRRNLPDGFPFALFAALWFSAMIFVVVAALTGRSLAAGDAAKHPVRIVLGAVFALSIAVFWGFLFMDQLPCFQGVPNCD